MKNRRSQTVSASKPRDALSAAQSAAISMRKQLCDFKSRNPGLRSGTMDDALKLADTIETLSRFGTSQSAEVAIGIVGVVETLSEQLQAEVDAILHPEIDAYMG